MNAMQFTRPARVAALALATVMLSATVFAQSSLWLIPGKRIRLVLPFPAGGAGTDMMARIIGKKLSEDAGVPVVVDNKPGASTLIGA